MAARSGPEVARAYVTIMPSMEGAQREISKGVIDAATKGGEEGGKAVGKEIGKGGTEGGNLFAKAFDSITGSKLGSTLSSVGGKLTSGFSAIGAKATEGFTAKFPELSAQMNKTAFGVELALSGAFDKASGKVGGFLSDLKASCGSTATMVGDQFRQLGANLSGAFDGSKLGQAFNAVASGAKGAFDAITAKATTVAGTVLGAFVGLGGSAAAAFQGIGSAAASAFGALASGPVGTAVSAIGGALGKVGGFALEAFGKVGEHAANFFGKAKEIASSACSAIGGFLAPIGQLAATAFSALGGFALEAGKQALSSYADYEQLVGGVETLFGTRGAKTLEDYAKLVGKSTADASADFESHARAESKALENARKAFQTCGMSANAYMEQSTAFAASLVSSLGGDTEAAVRYADMAMVDMSDNANKMGTDVARIQDAYQGFAKQNYTMLDNLKLGYGGTKTEMERLLKDAEAIKLKQGEVAEYSIDSYADVVEAIHVVQEEMGITGTTAEEAEHTISGSIHMMEASWENFLVGLADGNQDLGALTDDLMHSVGAVADNVVPRIVEIGTVVITKLPEALGKAASALPGIAIPLLAEGITAIGNALREQVAAWGIKIPEFDSGDMEKGLQQAWKTATGIFDGIKADVEAAVGEIRKTLGVVGQAFSETFGKPEVQASIQGLMDAAGRLGSKIGELASGAFAKLQEVIQFLAPHLANLAAAALPAISAAADAVTGALGFLGGAFDLVVSLATPIIAVLMDGIAGAAPIVTGAFDLIGSALSFLGDLFGQAASWITEKWQAVCDFFAPVGDFFGGIAEGIGSALGIAADNVEAAGSRMTESFSGVQAGADTSFSAANKSITDAISDAKTKATADGSTIETKLRDNFDNVKGAASSDFTAANKSITDNMASAKTSASGSAGQLQSNVTGSLSAAKTSGSSSVSALKSSIETNMANAASAASAKAALINTDVSGKLDAAEKAGTKSFGGLHSSITSKITEASSIVKQKADLINTEMEFSKIEKSAMSAFQRVNTAASAKMGDALQIVRGSVANMQAAVANTSFRFNQRIALPHFSMSGRFDAQSGATPRVSVAWYRRGSVFDGPSVIGVGEQPGVKEMVAPLSGQNMRPFAKAIADEMPQGASGLAVSFNIDKFNNYGPQGARQFADEAARRTGAAMKARGLAK